MPLGYTLLKNEIENGNIIIDPYVPENVRECSIDLTLGKEMRRVVNNSVDEYGNKIIDTKFPGEGIILKPNKDGSYTLYPGEFYLGHTAEKAGSNIYQPSIETRSSLARLGCMVHLCAGYGEPGFVDSQWTLEIVVFGQYPLKLWPGTRVCQILFDEVQGPIKKYEGKYKGQNGARLSKGLI